MYIVFWIDCFSELLDGKSVRWSALKTSGLQDVWQVLPAFQNSMDGRFPETLTLLCGPGFVMVGFPLFQTIYMYVYIHIYDMHDIYIYMRVYGIYIYMCVYIYTIYAHIYD